MDNLNNPNVLHQLFGNVSFTTLATNLEPLINDLLWHLKKPLGYITYLKIWSESRRAEALIHTLDVRKNDKHLTNAFQEYVMNSDGLYHLLTHEARLHVDQRRSVSSEPGRRGVDEPTDTLPVSRHDQRPYVSFYVKPGAEDPTSSYPRKFTRPTEPSPPQRFITPVRIPSRSGIYHIATDGSLTAAPEAQWLPQVSLHSHSKLYDTAACTILSQIFVNPSQDAPIANAKYTFPLYESCAIVAFRCHVGSYRIEGVVKEKQEAKAKYKEAITLGETAGLLEQHAPDVFTASIGNIPVGEKVTVEIEYIMELKHDAEIDGIRFTIPTSIAPRYGSPPNDLTWNAGQGITVKGGINISVEITMGSDIKSVAVSFAYNDCFVVSSDEYNSVTVTSNLGTPWRPCRRHTAGRI
jgi:hypothetical protein